MPKTEKKTQAIRYRFSVPEDDVSVVQWLKNQNNISSSLRTLVRDAIRSTGMQDVTCVPVEQYAKRGRPSNAELLAREAEKHEPEPETVVETEVQETIPEPVEIPKPAERQPERPQAAPPVHNDSDNIGVVPGLSEAGGELLGLLG